MIVPLMDIPTVTSNMAAFDIYKYIKKKPTIDLDILHGGFATRSFYALRSNTKKYDAVFYLGHGEKNRLMGNHMFWSIINRKNIDNVKGSIFATMACFSSDGLGRYAVNNGVKSYIGCKKEYYAFFPEKERNYLDDWRHIVGTYFKGIVDGKTIGEAYGRSREVSKHYLNIYWKNRHYRNYDWYYRALKHNIDNMELLGDPDARLFANEEEF